MMSETPVHKPPQSTDVEVKDPAAATPAGNEPATLPAPVDRTEPAGMESWCNDLRERLDGVLNRIANLEAAVETTNRQIAFIPPQVRMLGNRVDSMATAITEPRLRAVLLNLLGIYDLVDQLLRMLPQGGSDAPADHKRNYQVLRTQLRQILDANGLSEIPADGTFDPELHRAAQTIPCADSTESGHILGVVRPGFRTEQAVLRYAEVIVSRYTQPDQQK